MLRWLLIVGLIVSAVETSARAAETVRIATWNCEFLVRRTIYAKYGVPIDQKQWSDEQRALWSSADYRDARFRESTQAAAKFLANLSADVLALCEVGDPQDVDDLRAALKEQGAEYKYSAVCDSADRFLGQHVAVLSKLPLKSVLREIPGRESYLMELDDPEQEDETGLSKGLRVVFEVRNEPVNLYLTHLKSEMGGHESDAQRIAQASIIRRNYLRDLHRGEHVVVAGDLNDHPGQPTINRIRGLDDIDEDLWQTGAARFFDPNELDQRWTHAYLGVREQIDHVLISHSLYSRADRGRGVRSRTVAPVEKLPGTDQLVSDHRAFVVTLRIP